MPQIVPFILPGGQLEVPPVLWVVSLAVTCLILTFDVIVIGRRPHEPSMKECATYLSVYVGMAVAFGLFMWLHYGKTPGLEFFSGWLTEYSLSIDNLFIFIIIMSKFAVPRKYQQFALMVGIILALVMRAIFIFVGAAAINAAAWVFYLFGAFLIYTAIKLWQEDSHSEENEYHEPKAVSFFKRILPSTDSYHGTKLSVRLTGKRLWTPMLFVLIAIGMTDLLFALDSIPAIYGLTKEPYIVLMANIFALMGLRQLYFLIGGLLQRLVYLSKGLSFLLVFIGVKLILHAMHENNLPFLNNGRGFNVPDIPIWLSLAVIVGTLAVTAVWSLVATRSVPVAAGDPQDVQERVQVLPDPHPEYATDDNADAAAVAKARELAQAQEPTARDGAPRPPK